MNLKINVYTDDTLQEVKREAEADRLKIPYRVAINVAKSLETVELENKGDILKTVTQNMESVDKIMKATFRLTDEELECVDAGEMAAVVKEIYKWAVDKMKGIKGGSEKNLMATA